jgi:hypothetical protein
MFGGKTSTQFLDQIIDRPFYVVPESGKLVSPTPIRRESIVVQVAIADMPKAIDADFTNSGDSGSGTIDELGKVRQWQ